MKTLFLIVVFQLLTVLLINERLFADVNCRSFFVNRNIDLSKKRSLRNLIITLTLNQASRVQQNKVSHQIEEGSQNLITANQIQATTLAKGSRTRDQANQELHLTGQKTHTPRSQTPVIVNVLHRQFLKRIILEQNGQTIFIESENILNDIGIIVPSPRMVAHLELRAITGEVFTLKYTPALQLIDLGVSSLPRKSLNFYFYNNHRIALAVSSIFPMFSVRFQESIEEI